RFYLATDVVAWDDSLNQAIGLLARIQSPGLGTTLGYAFTYQVGSHDVQISRVDNESARPASPSVAVTLNPTNRYVFVFVGNGSALEGRVYLASDLKRPLAVASGNDSAYENGTTGLLVYDNTSGGTGTADATFDNYFATDIEPPTLT